MSLFKNQPLFCGNCGANYDGDPTKNWCSENCRQEIEWKITLFTLGKEYYPRENYHV